MRQGAFKAHFLTHETYGKVEPSKHNPSLLFNLEQDPSEWFNIAAQHADVVAALTKIFEQHRSTVTRGKLQF